MADPISTCTKAPKGWHCIREAGHEGPCAAIKQQGRWSRLMDQLGAVIGDYMFGGRR